MFWVRQRKWCDVDQDVCSNLSHESDKFYLNHLRKKYDRMPKDLRIELGHQMNDFVIYTEYDDKICNGTISQFYDYEYTNCFTFNALWDSTHKVDEATLFNPVTGKSSELVMCVNMDIENYSPMTTTRRTRVSIHASDIVPNPRSDGVSIQAGNFYTYGVQKETVHLLERPYQTNCRNYSQEKETRTGGRMSQENCLLECFKNVSLKLCHCTHRRLSLLYDAVYCESKEKKACLSNVNEEAKIICYKECPMACKKVNYVFIAVDNEPLRIDSELYSKIGTEDLFPTHDKMLENMACLQVHYGSMENTLLVHHPKYELIEMFSLIGGYSGLWLGFSLLAGYSFLLSVIEKKKKWRVQKKKKKKKMNCRHHKSIHNTGIPFHSQKKFKVYSKQKKNTFFQ